MAIKTVTESWEKRTVEDTRTETTAVRTFSVEFDTGDDPVARPILALRHAGIPQYGNEHPFRRGMYVKTRSVNVIGAFVYEVTVNYSSAAESGSTEKEENPLKQKPKINWTFNTSSEPIDTAIALIEPKNTKNVVITNSSGEPPDPPINADKHDLVLQYSRNERTFKPMIAIRYKGAVNADTFLGSPPDTVKCTVFDAEKVYDDKWGDYYKMTYEFQFRIEEVDGKKYGWNFRTHDKGFYECDSINKDGTPHLVPIMDDGAPADPQADPPAEEVQPQRITEPVALNGKGRKKKKNEKDVYLVYQICPKVSFSSLNIVEG